MDFDAEGEVETARRGVSRGGASRLLEGLVGFGGGVGGVWWGLVECSAAVAWDAKMSIDQY